jgi:hypothetical protein
MLILTGPRVVARNDLSLPASSSRFVMRTITRRQAELWQTCPNGDAVTLGAGISLL